MTIYLPEIRPEYPWPHKVSLFFFKWVAWFVEAGSTALDDDVGTEYQWGVTMLVCLGWIGLLGPILLHVSGIISTLEATGLWTVGLYLAVGALYHAFENYGPYRTH